MLINPTLEKHSKLAALLEDARVWQRKRFLPLLGIGIGLVAAGVGIFRSMPKPITSVPPGYVAVVNGKGVLMSDFISQTAYEAEKPFRQTSAAERRRVLREMIDKELLVQRGVALDLPETTIEVRTVMSQSVTAQVSAPLLAVEPTVAQLREYYDRHRSDYTTDGTMTVHDLVLRVGGYQNVDQSIAQAESDAGNAAYELRSGAAIGYIKEHYGFVDSGRSDNTQQLDFAAKIHLGPSLYKAAAALNTGEVSDPIVESDGVHVLIMDQRQPPSVAPFDKVRNKVYLAYRGAEQKQATEENLKILRGRAQILVAPGFSE